MPGPKFTSGGIYTRIHFKFGGVVASDCKEFPSVRPQDLPEGHDAVSLEDVEKMTCGYCIDSAREILEMRGEACV